MKANHNYKIGDEVYYPVDRAPFKVIGIKIDTVEIEGDFSGGTHNVTQHDWVEPTEIKPFDWSKLNGPGPSRI